MFKARFSDLNGYLMWVSGIKIKNIKGFQDSGDIELSKSVNILVGPNNAGKSIILKSLYRLQKDDSIEEHDIRINSDEGHVAIRIQDWAQSQGLLALSNEVFNASNNNEELTLDVKITRGQNSLAYTWNGQIHGINVISKTEPKNFIYPCLAKRKVIVLKQDVNIQVSTSVSENLENLVAKIDRISNPEFPAYAEYKKACQDILGFSVSSFPSENGKHAGITIGNFQNISVEVMGEGIAQILGLITDLCIAKDKLFLIEEPENDIHPAALKRLLAFILKKSSRNQFVISTHSNIVTKYLGALKSAKVFKVDMKIADDKIPMSSITEVSGPEQRQALLEELGYDLFDSGLWEGWLFLEESTAEKIVREYFIPWFAKALQNRLRTLAARGVSNVRPKFEDLHRLFLFAHLEPLLYKNRAWVIIDGDEEGIRIVQQLKQDFASSGWSSDRFQALAKTNFEDYYPPAFSEKVKKVHAITDKKKKAASKNTVAK